VVAAPSISAHDGVAGLRPLGVVSEASSMVVEKSLDFSLVGRRVVIR